MKTLKPTGILFIMIVIRVVLTFSAGCEKLASYIPNYNNANVNAPLAGSTNHVAAMYSSSFCPASGLPDIAEIPG